MANATYPDDDGSRSPQGAHDEGRQRVSLCNMQARMRPPTVADMATNADPLNNMSDSMGDRSVPNHGWAVDGNAGEDGHRYIPAAYPTAIDPT